MKAKFTIICTLLLLLSAFSYSQEKGDAKSIINTKVGIKKYYNKSELEKLNKGLLLELYLERIAVLSNTMPYIAFATKPGVTMSDLGIPNTKENRKALESEHENTEVYIKNTADFQKILLPYTDTSKLIDSILFYEEVLKLIHTYNSYR